MANISNIREHMDIYDKAGELIGKVDHLEGSDEIKMTKDGYSGHHHFIPVSWVDRVDSHVHLAKTMDEVTAQWRHE
jgi:hypothetical protein